jgi:hypothetical protein
VKKLHKFLRNKNDELNSCMTDNAASFFNLLIYRIAQPEYKE